jgi:hypothetical protein
MGFTSLCVRHAGSIGYDECRIMVVAADWSTLERPKLSQFPAPESSALCRKLAQGADVTLVPSLRH